MQRMRKGGGCGRETHLGLMSEISMRHARMLLHRGGASEWIAAESTKTKHIRQKKLKQKKPTDGELD